MLTLIQFNPDDTRKPQTFRLSVDQPHIIGRRQGDVKLADSRISRQHAEVSVQNGTWVIRDMSSSNGTWVNGERIEGLCELEEGDRLVIGRITLLVGHVDAQAPATTPADVGSASTPTRGSDEASISETTPTIDEPQPLDLDEDLDHLDLDAELDLSSIDLDELTDGDDADAVKEEPSVEVAADDLLDLNDAEKDSSDDAVLDAGAFSLAPALTAEVTDELPHEVAEEEDEYAASVDFITPTTRPESPLDGVETSPGDESKSQVEVESEVEQAMAGVDEDDEAPPVVGLSLGMPAPDVPNEDASVEAEDEVTLDDAAPEPPQAKEDHAAHDDTGLDVELDDDLSSINLEGDLALEDDLALDNDPADAPPSATAESDAPPPAEPEPVATADEPREPDLVDSEEQQELELAWSGQQSSRLKGVLALVVFALVIGGGVWLTLFNGNNSSITGVTPGEGLQPTPTDNIIAKTTETTPKLADAAPTSPPVNTAQPAPTPAVSDPTPVTSDAFGQAPTLSVPPPRTTPAAAAPASPMPAPAVERVEEPITPANLSAEPEPTAAEPELPTLAMIDPTPAPGISTSIVPDPLTGGAGPTADALREIESGDEEQVEDAATPGVVGPARRIVFVIDASGSMVDSMNQGALSWLEQRLDTLTDRDRFAVLFFRSGEVIEVPPAGLTLADSLNRERVLAWTDPDTGNVRPRGKSEPMNALQQAQQYDPTDVFILSDDKFGERGNSAAINVGDIERLLGTGPAVVHTVQFFYPNPDNRTLQAIAQRLGGTYEFVEEPPFDLDPNSDIGLDLLGISR